MLTRLEAERALGHVAELQAADSNLEANSRQRIINDLKRAAVPPSEQHKPTKDEFMAQMAALGFRITV